MMSSEQLRERSVNAKKPSLRMAGVENNKLSYPQTEDRRQPVGSKPGLGHLGAAGRFPASLVAAQNRHLGSEGSTGTSPPDAGLKHGFAHPDFSERSHHHHHDFRIVQQTGQNLNERKTADQVTSSINKAQIPPTKFEDRVAVEGPFSALPKKATGKFVGARPCSPS